MGIGVANGNFAAACAAVLTSVGERRAPATKWVILLALAVVWLGAGVLGWTAAAGTNAAPVSVLEAFYRTLGALGASSDYYADAIGERERYLGIARFAGVLLALGALIAGLWTQIIRSLAQLFSFGMARHVVIAGDGPDAVALALDCAQHRDAVALIGRAVAEETAYELRRKGVIVILGDPEMAAVLRAARAGLASHVVALTGDDGANLRIEAAVRRLCDAARRKRPLATHTCFASPLLLREAREMRTQEMRSAKAAAATLAFEPRPFSLQELAARRLLAKHLGEMLDMAESLGHERPHLVAFGFDPTAEAVAMRFLMSVWSARMGAPRVTIVGPDAMDDHARCMARHAEAQAHDLWRADIAPFAWDWEHRPIDVDTITALAAARGAPTAFVVSTGDDAVNIGVALALRRACNAPILDASGREREDRTFMPAAIFMKEASRSEFSRMWASGDTTDRLDAYLQAFGASEDVATRALIVGGALDTGPAIAHWFYQHKVEDFAGLTPKMLHAARRGFVGIRETFRNANRAVADSAAVKLWDAGYRPARRGEAGVPAPDLTPWIDALARREHDRWNAERMLSGWRPGATRNDDMRVHPMLRPFEALSEAEVEKDRQQVRAAIAILRALHPEGFVKRERRPASP